ncbi:PDZ domain-containing protein [bacterium CPR1]|nr:PDZ domain-containing protein [bacterium CPR1]
MVLIAFLAADLTAAALEQRLQLPIPAVSASPSKAPSPAPATTAQPAAAIPGELVSVLDTRPPEPVIEPGDPTDPSAPEAAAASPVNVQLKGTILGAGGVSLAVLSDGGETRLLSVGEQIGDLTLAEVTQHSATLKRGQETVVLSLLDSGSSGGPSPAASAPASLNTPVAPAPSQVKPPETMAEMQELLNNPATASEGFKLTPINRKGESYGVMLEFRKSSNLMSAIGLRHGDILLNVNGRPLKSGEDMYTAYQEMRNSPTVSFEVDRGGQVLPIKFEVKE